MPSSVRTTAAERFAEALRAEERAEAERRRAFRARFRRSPCGGLVATWEVWLHGGGGEVTEYRCTACISRAPTGSYFYSVAVHSEYYGRGGFASEEDALDALVALCGGVSRCR